MKQNANTDKRKGIREYGKKDGRMENKYSMMERYERQRKKTKA